MLLLSSFLFYYYQCYHYFLYCFSIIDLIISVASPVSSLLLQVLLTFYFQVFSLSVTQFEEDCLFMCVHQVFPATRAHLLEQTVFEQPQPSGDGAGPARAEGKTEKGHPQQWLRCESLNNSHTVR